MQEPDTTKPPTDAAQEPERQAPKRKRRLALLAIACSLPVLLTAGALGAAWTGYRLYDEPFAWYNMNRIAATAERSARTPDNSVKVVALGDGALREATLDERAMAELGRQNGIDDLHVLRIVKQDAQFADFTPMLDRILAIKPDLILIDLDLGFRERRATADMQRYMGRLTGFAMDGEAYLQDQVAVQYRRACAGPGVSVPPAALDLTALDSVVDRMNGTLETRTDSPALDQLRLFAERAGRAGAKVALVEMRRSPALEERLYGPGNAHPPGVLERAAGEATLPLWRFPEEIRRTADYCATGTLGASARTAYSAWLTEAVADTLGITPPDEVALDRDDMNQDGVITTSTVLPPRKPSRPQ